MVESIMYVGLDVQKDMIAAALAEYPSAGHRVGLLTEIPDLNGAL
jgi:hypothetical protein